MPSITETKCREHVSYVVARGTTMTSRITSPRRTFWRVAVLYELQYLYTLIYVRHSTGFALSSLKYNKQCRADLLQHTIIRDTSALLGITKELTA